MSRSPGLGFFLLILLNATLFVRPAELVPALVDLPIYNAIMLSCLAVSASAVSRQLASSAGQNSINVCVFGMLVGVMISHLSHFRISEAIGCGFEFSKVLLYYYLLVAVLDSFMRLSNVSALALLLCRGPQLVVSRPLLRDRHDSGA